MKPRSLMYTLYGDYIRHFGGEIWIGSLIKLMNNFGISESSVRGATLRMVQQGLLTVRKVGNNSYYSLSQTGRRRVEDGVKRVYSIENRKWDGYWRIVTYSISEDKRKLRNQIRKELIWTGFGLVSNSILVSPNPVEDQVMEMIRTYKLENDVLLFSSSRVLSHDNQGLIEKGWDFDEIDMEYKQFIDMYTIKFEQLKEAIWKEQLPDVDAFIERTVLVHEFRKFLFRDPSFPQELLPANWSGSKARGLFGNIYQLISNQAVRYFESVYKQAPDKEEMFDINKAMNPFTEVYSNK